MMQKEEEDIMIVTLGLVLQNRKNGVCIEYLKFYF